MSSPGAKVLTILFVGGLSWYSGIKFWQPLIIDQLKKDGNLREDVYVRDTSDQPKSWSDLKEKVKTTLHPELYDNNNSTENGVNKQVIDETVLTNSKRDD